VLPDLVPEPPVDLRVTQKDDEIHIRFSSVLVNVGLGDFVLRGVRSSDEWSIQQEIAYSESGGELVDTDATLAWGGDGHQHWHVKRVANYWLVPIVDGDPGDYDSALMDSKIGFCFWDFGKDLDHGPDKPVFFADGCGLEDDTEMRMGLSPGWNDTYPFTLPGQNIDITNVPDGDYRLWAEADVSRWFTEASLDNNVTWIDFTLETRDGLRFAQLTAVGPEPG